jgi:hypothetical protein
VDQATVNLSQAIRLDPVHIAKPWGQEIWFSGMEARGESRVIGEDGQSLPLSQYLACAPKRLHQQLPVTLLKVLDPLPQRVTGDLYFEVHEEKREVYVVTSIDPKAWPDGQGGIRFGMDQTRRSEAESDKAFRSAFLASVKTYEQIRRSIDAGERIDPQAERQARADYEAFTAMRRLNVGDVVVVPTWTPHSLQHGVRVVEFQTPTYERYIIAFAQKVLTQNHWDSEHAVANMSLDAPDEPAFEQVNDHLERVARFDHFNVCRGVVGPDPHTLRSNLPYALVISLDGHMNVGGLRLAPEQAAFIPGHVLGRISLSASSATRYLTAAPGI